MILRNIARIIWQISFITFLIYLLSLNLTNLLKHGSITSVILMSYASGVVAVSKYMLSKLSINPPILYHTLSKIMMVLIQLGAFWIAIYIGSYDGFISGITSLFALPILSYVVLLALRGAKWIGIHFIIASALFPIGLFLSIRSYIA